MSGGINNARRAFKLKEIALSEKNTGSERIRAIELLGRLNGHGYDALADIAANGLSRIERINALEILAKLFKDIPMSGGEQGAPMEAIPIKEVPIKSQSTIEIQPAKAVRKGPERRKKTAKTAQRLKYKLTPSNELADEVFDEMLHYVKPLLSSEIGCSESEIKKQFRNLKGSVVETFLTMAIRRGIIKEIIPGTFKLTSTIE